MYIISPLNQRKKDLQKKKKQFTEKEKRNVALIVQRKTIIRKI